MHSINNLNRTEHRQELFIRLYKNAFPPVAKYVSRLGGSLEEAKDVFQDAVVIFYETTNKHSSTFYNETAYVVGISKNLWVKRYRQSIKNLPLNDINLASDETEEMPSNNRILRFLSAAGQKCMDLLKSFYYDDLALSEIAREFGYSGVRSATVQKYKCLEKVREIIKEKALAYDDFLE
jgi:DNA-directed RNA polymerase specialized sigma24 family protein